MLIDGGAPGAPLAVDPFGRGRGHARRPGHVGAVRAAPSHVVIAPGAPGLADLIAGVDRGLLVEAAGPARVDPIRWQVVVPVGVGRRLERGRRTGHVHADLELRADVPALLGGVTAASREVRTSARRDVIDGEPLCAIDVVTVAGDPSGDRTASRRRVSRFDDLARALRQARARREWVAAARTRVVGAVGHGADEGRRVDRRTELTATVFRDLPAGRGAAQVAIPGSRRLAMP